MRLFAVSLFLAFVEMTCAYDFCYLMTDKSIVNLEMYCCRYDLIHLTMLICFESCI